MGESIAPATQTTLVDVLIIDDSDLIRMSLERLIRRAGFQVLSLASPVGATREIIRRRVKLVILDVHMPAIRGDRFVTQLRQTAACANVRVVLLSGLSGPELMQLAAEVGADGVVEKGTSPDELVRTVQRLMPEG